MIVDEPKKKGNGLVTVVIILLLICFGLGGFIYLNKDKIFTQQTKETTEKTTEADTPKKTEYNKDGYFIQDLMDKIIYFTGGNTQEYEVYAKDKVTVEDLTDSYKNTLAIKQIGNDKSQFLNKEDLKEGSIKAFGKNIYSTYPEKFEAFCNIYTFNGTYYEYENPGCGGIGPERYTEITKIDSDDNHIYVYQKAGFYGDKGIYKNVSIKKTNGYNEYEVTDFIKEDDFPSTVKMSEILDQLNEYKFTFTYDETNNIYYFESVEKVNN